jgi:hypothetical protein
VGELTYTVKALVEAEDQVAAAAAAALLAVMEAPEGVVPLEAAADLTGIVVHQMVRVAAEELPGFFGAART